MSKAPYTNVNMHLTGAAREAVQKRAAERGLSNGMAAISLIEDAIANAVAVAPPAPTPTDDGRDGTKASADLFFANLPNHWLIDELSRRMNAGVADADYEAAVARADGAEAELASLKDRIGGLLQ